MKKRQNNSARASALQITLSVALMSVAAILFASSFRAAAPAAPVRAKSDLVLAMNAPATQPAPQQSGFFPALPDAPGANVPQGPTPPPIVNPAE